MARGGERAARSAASARERAGVAARQVLLDPGIGFAKDAAHSLEVLRACPSSQSLDRPLLVGPSRKSFIGKVLDLPAGERLIGTAAAVAACVLGGAHVVRVHDVARHGRRSRGSATRSCRRTRIAAWRAVFVDRIFTTLRAIDVLVARRSSTS